MTDDEKKTCELCGKLGIHYSVDGKCGLLGCLQSAEPKKILILSKVAQIQGKINALKAEADELRALMSLLQDQAALHK